MLNYSIVMRSINSNLLNINQAKSRINAAKAAGQTPAQEDVELVATEKKMPPPGQIHDSVLYIFAQILIYCGSIFGIDSYISRKLRDMNPPNHPKPL
ncbi:MAG: hypothetical protein PUB62_02330 [Prevotellaceae bacterium]|nr:hypothetical protein [Prevotellaceae bacterium]